MIKENLNNIKTRYNRECEEAVKENEELPEEPEIYKMTLSITGLTPSICSLNQCDKRDFRKIKRRQLLIPLSLNLVDRYNLRYCGPSLADNSNFDCKFTREIDASEFKTKLSITDLHLLF